ncbi:hypothetical protein Bp8pS_184 [Bacillus phage vB_BpuM-BpSp]|nr:hypothetical protein Bp8pS_184 [Bacillus phage vB_BpuM-BpSp]
MKVLNFEDISFLKRNPDLINTNELVTGNYRLSKELLDNIELSDYDWQYISNNLIEYKYLFDEVNIFDYFYNLYWDAIFANNVFEEKSYKRFINKLVELYKETKHQFLYKDYINIKDVISGIVSSKKIDEEDISNFEYIENVTKSFINSSGSPYLWEIISYNLEIERDFRIIEKFKDKIIWDKLLSHSYEKINLKFYSKYKEYFGGGDKIFIVSQNSNKDLVYKIIKENVNSSDEYKNYIIKCISKNKSLCNDKDINTLIKLYPI